MHYANIIYFNISQHEDTQVGFMHAVCASDGRKYETYYIKEYNKSGSGTLEEEMKEKTSEQLWELRWRGSALEEDRSCGEKILSGGT